MQSQKSRWAPLHPDQSAIHLHQPPSPNFYAGCPSRRNAPNLSCLGTGTGICRHCWNFLFCYQMTFLWLTAKNRRQSFKFLNRLIETVDLKGADEVVCQRPGVRGDRHVAVQLSQSSACHLGAILTNVIFAKKELKIPHNTELHLSVSVKLQAGGTFPKRKSLGIPGVGFYRPLSSPNSGNKCLLARPLMLPNFVTLQQEVCEISAAENFCSRKSGPKFAKIP